MESDEPPQSDDTLRINVTPAGKRSLKNSHPAVLIHINEETPKIWEIKNGEYTIGRNPDCDICITTQGVSRHHATIFANDQKTYISDNNSTNGIVVNDEQLNNVELKLNDIIQLGECNLKYVPKGHFELSYLSKLYKSSQTDDLTSCLRKDPFISLVENEIRLFSQEFKPFSLLFIDLDKFKNVNDVIGHLGGDYVLKTVSNLLKTNAMRSSDSICRYGGDEFIIHLPETDSTMAKKIGFRAKDTIENFKFNFDNNAIDITISVGVTTCNDKKSTLNTLIASVDKKMYEAKKLGRNTVIS